MIIFSPDGKYTYVCSSFTPETVVIDTATYEIVGRIKQVSTFCPNIAASPDGYQVGIGPCSFCQQGSWFWLLLQMSSAAGHVFFCS
jgi:sugar lactone lactonase YvrE